jgi:hypothetical protein
MHVEQVEIYSDASNLAVLRHPGRRFPGLLIQGDTLYTLCFAADEACRLARQHGCSEVLDEINELRNTLWSRLNHYKQVLAEHDIELPFSELPREGL